MSLNIKRTLLQIKLAELILNGRTTLFDVYDDFYIDEILKKYPTIIINYYKAIPKNKIFNNKKYKTLDLYIFSLKKENSKYRPGDILFPDSGPEYYIEYIRNVDSLSFYWS